MGAKRKITHKVDGGIIETISGGLGGSRHLVEIAYGKRTANILLDIGGNQLSGTPEIVKDFDPLRNIDVSKLDAVVVSHIHQDHNGDVVHLTKGGYGKEIVMTNTSKSLTEIITRDNLKQQSEEKSAENKKIKEERDNIRKAVYTIQAKLEIKNTRNKKPQNHDTMDLRKAAEILERYNINPSKIKSEADLKKYKPTFKTREFNEHDVKVMLETIKPLPYHQEHVLVKDFVKTKFYNAGHVEGSAQVLLKIIGNLRSPKNTLNMLYTGDIGRFKQPGLTGEPEIPKERIDYLVIEGTYGDKIHPDREIEKAKLIEQINTAKGLTLIPCFAIQRFQEVIDIIGCAIKDNSITLHGNEKVFLHSNLAYDISKEYLAKDVDNKYPHLRNSSHIERVTDGTIVKGLMFGKGRRIVVCSGGMLENGSIMQYLHHATQSKNAKILTTGFQAPGTIGERLSHNDFSKDIIVNDKKIVHNKAAMRGFSFSGHADQEELIHYISKLNLARNVEITIVHGGVQRLGLAEKLEQLLHARDKSKKIDHRGLWKIHVPEKNGDSITIKEPQNISL